MGCPNKRQIKEGMVSVMIKVGVLTFHSADNYGSVLQTYALQKYLELEHGLVAEVINFIPDGQEELYKLFAPVKSPRNIIGNLLKTPIYFKFEKRKKAFKNFRGRVRISLGSYRSKNDFSHILDKYDMIIVGSDQVWNPDCVDFSPIYLLDGIHVPIKASYAPSVNEKKIDDVQWYLQCVNDFDFVSVREVAAQRYLQVEGNRRFGVDFKNVEVTIDPTLLLNKEEYEKIASSPLIEGDYIFAYSVYNDPEYLKWLQQIASVSGLTIVSMITGNNSYKLLKNKAIILPEDQSPNAFLSGIQHAKYVVTNSFHGTAFSIIFKKNFYYFGDYQKDERIKTIIDNFSLQQCCVQDAKKEYFMMETQYEDYEGNLKRVRKTSEKYLKEVVSAYERYSLSK